MKKEKIFYKIFVLCIILVLVITLQSMAKVDPHGIFLDEKGHPRNANISQLDWTFLNIKIEMIMEHPDFFPRIDINYDQKGVYGEMMEEYVSLQTRGKIVINICDTRKFYASIETNPELLNQLDILRFLLKMKLFGITNDFDNDVVIYVIPSEGLRDGGMLAYFYKGEFVILKDLSK